MNGKYSIKKLCQAAGVSVRTLHYYDEIGLLKPKYRTAKGHRLYSENEVLLLQQIVTLKFIGLSLDQIQKHLHFLRATGLKPFTSNISIKPAMSLRLIQIKSL